MEEWTYKYNRKFILRSGGVYDMAFMLHLLRPNNLFVDIGTYIGSYTILASAKIKANTIAIVPITATFKF